MPLLEAPPIEHFIVIGAGASTGARDASLEGMRPPLGRELATYISHWFAQNAPGPTARGRARDPLNFEVPSLDLWEPKFADRFREFLKEAQKSNDFESALASFVDGSDQRIDDLRTINRIIAQSMLLGDGCRLLEERDLYDDAVERWVGVDRDKRIAIISLNYDILLEEAVARVFRATDPLVAISYPGIRGIGEIDQSGLRRVPVFKPHGSINWIAGNNITVGARFNDLDRGLPSTKASMLDGNPIGTDTGFEYVPPRGRRGYICALKHFRKPSPRPILALYMEGKPISSNQTACLNARSECLSVVRANPQAAVTAIGLRLPKADSDPDPSLSDLFDAFRATEGEKVYVSPCEDDRRCAESWGFSPRQTTLREYLDHGTCEDR